MNFIELVRQFQEDKLQPAPTVATALTPEREALRNKWLQGEFNELLEALNTPENKTHIIKELCDVLYIACGTMVEKGYHIEESLHIADISGNSFEKLNNAILAFQIGANYATYKNLKNAIIRHATIVCGVEFWDFVVCFVIVHANNMMKPRPDKFGERVQKGNVENCEPRIKQYLYDRD